MNIFKLNKSFVLICLCLSFGIINGLVDADFYWQKFLGCNYLHGVFDVSQKITWGIFGLQPDYPDHEWFANIIIYLFSLLPFGLIFLHFFIIFCVLISVYIYTNGSYTINKLLIVFLLVYSFLLLNIKPYVFSLCFLLLTLRLLDDYKSRKFSFNLFYAVMLTILWNNIHGASVIVFFGVCGLYYLINIRDMDMLIIGICCLLSLLINPFGYKLISYSIGHISSGMLNNVNTEWSGIDANTFYGKLYLFCILVAFYLLFKSKCTDKFYIALFFILCILSISSHRHVLYMLPLVLKFSYDSGLNKCIKYYSLILSGVLVICLISSFAHYSKYSKSSIFSNELKEVILNNDDNLLNDSSCYVLSLNVKVFYAWYPYFRERVKDAYSMYNYDTSEEIEEKINKYNFKNFLIDKSDFTTRLLEYLNKNTKYKLLYEDDNFLFFSERNKFN